MTVDYIPKPRKTISPFQFNLDHRKIIKWGFSSHVRIEYEYAHLTASVTTQSSATRKQTTNRRSHEMNSIEKFLSLEADYEYFLNVPQNRFISNCIIIMYEGEE